MEVHQGQALLSSSFWLMSEHITIVETPRDAFQGLQKPVPTAEKIRYIRALLDAGFKHIDLGSFVSAQAVPQMADSATVIRAFKQEKVLERLAIVVNEQGLERAVEVGGLDSLGFPFSLAKQFQLQNTRTTVTATWPVVEWLISRTEKNDMSFILYLSMAFGNPYGEPWDEEALFGFIRNLVSVGVRHVSLSDTIAIAKPEQVKRIFLRAKREQPHVQFSAHFHGRPENWFECVKAALDAGCRRFDAAAGGLGGCPFAQDALVANIPSNSLVRKLSALGYETGVDLEKADTCAEIAQEFQKTYG